MDYNNDPRIVMTLDAGGTNFNFSAIRSNKEIIEPIILSAKGKNLTIILKTIIKGFEEVKEKLTEEPVAISFSFPGPADYQNGIIGDLQNLPEFRGGVALKPMLEEIFKIPVFINNDGDLFAYGEAIGGLLPEINKKLEETGNIKRYSNLLGVTFGTGFGGGIVSQGNLFFGDNSAGAEINRMRDMFYPETSSEDSLSIRAVKREFAKEAGIELTDCPEPKEIFEIGTGNLEGDRNAALLSFEKFATAAANAIADASTLIDGLVVIGGGLAGAYPLFLQKLVEEMNKGFVTLEGEPITRLEIDTYNLEDVKDLGRFLENNTVEIPVPFSDNKVKYNPDKKIGVGISRLGTSKAVSIGAYAFALHELDAK